jgi:hypothetical protein
MRPPLPTGALLVAFVLSQIPQCEVAYLRAHRQEPILAACVATSLLTGILVWQLGSRFEAVGAALSYLGVVGLATLPWITLIWIRCRAEWHRDGRVDGYVALDLSLQNTLADGD